MSLPPILRGYESLRDRNSSASHFVVPKRLTGSFASTTATASAATCRRPQWARPAGRACAALLQNNDNELTIAGGFAEAGYVAAIRAAAAPAGRGPVLIGLSKADTWHYPHYQAHWQPSLAEGFGLPVVAMPLGKPVFLNSLTSLPEVGGPAAHYFGNFAPAAMCQTQADGLARHSAAPLRPAPGSLARRRPRLRISLSTKAYWATGPLRT